VIDTTSVIPFESLYASEARTNDPLKELCTIPLDDVTIETVDKLHRTRFAEVDKQQIPQPCLQSVFESYRAPWVRVKRNYTEYDRAKMTTVWDLDPPAFEVDAVAAAVAEVEPVAPSTPKSAMKRLGITAEEAASTPPASSVDQLSVKQKLRRRAGSMRVKPTEPEKSPQSRRVSPTVPRPDPLLLAAAQKAKEQREQQAAERKKLMLESEEAVLKLDDDHFRLMEPYNGTPTDEDNRDSRAQDRLPIFRYYDPEYFWEPAEGIQLQTHSLKNPNVLLHSQQGVLQLRLKARALTLDLGALEPLYCSLCFYDVRTRQKISENFYFDFNDETILMMLGNARCPDPDPRTQVRSGLFTLSQKRNADVWLVLEVEKVLQGVDFDHCITPYTKIGSEKDMLKQRQKVKTEVPNFCNRLGAYRQSFAWGAMPVFAANGDLNMGYATRLSPIYPHHPKDDLFELITEQINDPSKASKRKTLTRDGHFLFDCVRVTEGMFPKRLGPLLQEIDQPDLSQREPGEPPSAAASGADADAATSSKSSKSTDGAPSSPSKNTSSAADGDDGNEQEDKEKKTKKKSKRSSSSSKKGKERASDGEEAEEEAEAAPRPSMEKDGESDAVAAAAPLTARRREAEVEVVREVTEFPQTPMLKPFVSPVHLLWVSPLLLDFSSRSGKYNNLCVEVQLRRGDISVMEPGPACLLSKSNSRGYTSLLRSQVVYHSQTPTFHDEWMIALPEALTPRDHLLFTVSHIVCKRSKGKEEEPVAQVAGFGVLPLFRNNRIVTADHAQDEPYGVMMWSAKKLEPGYLARLEPGYSGAEKLKLMDGGKPVLQLRMHLESSLYPQDARLADLFATYHFKEFFDDERLVAVLNEVHNADVTEMVRFLPTLLNMLLYVLCARTQHGADQPGMYAFKALLHVVIRVRRELQTRGLEKEHTERDGLLGLVVGWIFAGSIVGPHLKQSPHQALVHYLLLFMMAKNYSQHEDLPVDEVYPVVWFLFELVVKSLALNLNAQDLLLESDRSLAYRDGSDEQNVPKFVKQTVSFMAKHCIRKGISQENGNTVVARKLNSSLALFVRDLFHVFDRGHAHDIVRGYLSEMDVAPGVELTGDQRLLPSLRFEFIKVVADSEHFFSLNMPFMASSLNLTGSQDELLSSLLFHFPLSTKIIENILKTLVGDGTQITYNSHHALRALYGIIIKFDYDARYQERVARERVAYIFFSLLVLLVKQWHFMTVWRQRGSAEQHRDLYICMLWVLRNMNRELLRIWLRSQPTNNLLILLDIFKSSVSAFEYQPSDLKIKSAPTQANASSIRAKNGLQCQETSLVILDVLEDLVTDHTDQLAQLDMQTLKPKELTIQVFELYMLLFSSQQSVRLLNHVADALRSFLARFPRLFFVAKSEYCARLTTEVLQRSAAQDNGIRVQASTLLYLMLRHCHQVSGNIGRMISVTINCLSKLIDDDTLADDTLLRVSLTRIPLYATFEYSVPGRDPHLKYERRSARAQEVSSHLKAKFAREVHALTSTLGKILADTVQTNLLEKTADAEMRADLFLRIADGYAETPDLRIAWLEKLARLHQSAEHMAEAALCYVHIAYLIAVYLTQQGVALNMTPFRTLCPGAVVSVNEDLCQNTERFSKSGLVTAVRVSISFLRNAELFEYAALLYDVLLPVFRSTREFNNLSQAHRQLDAIWQDMWQRGNDRIFGKYYRVGFYSPRFGELDGKEFVYKLPKLTHLYELSGRLKEFYGKTLSGCEVVVMPDSGAVDRSTLDPLKAYLQITSVAPYFDEAELSERDTDFLRNTNLSRFVYDTPFTKGEGGASQTENVDEQWKRRTILTTEVAFPHMVTRIPVRARDDMVLSPIDVGIEEVSKRIISLRGEIDKKPPELKSLQLLLQGSVLIMVNAGVLEFARRFFGKPEPWSYAKLMLLGEKLRQFLKACSDALDLNREHSDGSPQAQNYDKELRVGYAQLYEEMTAYLERPLHEDECDRTEGTEMGTNTETDGLQEDLDDNLLLNENDSGESGDESQQSAAAAADKTKKKSKRRPHKYATLKVGAISSSSQDDGGKKSARRSSSSTPRRPSSASSTEPRTTRR